MRTRQCRSALGHRCRVRGWGRPQKTTIFPKVASTYESSSTISLRGFRIPLIMKKLALPLALVAVATAGSLAWLPLRLDYAGIPDTLFFVAVTAAAPSRNLR